MSSAVKSSKTPSLSMGIEEPLDLVKLNLDEVVYVRMKGERELVGRLHAFDQHMNLVLGDVEETRRFIESKQVEEESSNGEEVEWKTEVKKRGMLFIRGDAIILLSPATKSRV